MLMKQATMLVERTQRCLDSRLTENIFHQPIDGQVGEIFVMKPLFSNSLPSGTVGPVTAGDQIFTKPTYEHPADTTSAHLILDEGFSFIDLDLDIAVPRLPIEI
jgi:hypothetical protein